MYVFQGIIYKAKDITNCDLDLIIWASVIKQRGAGKSLPLHTTPTPNKNVKRAPPPKKMNHNII